MWGADAPPLRAKFGVPPFTVLEARQGYWRARRKAWLELGLQPEITPPKRGALTPGSAGGVSGMIAALNDTVSLFDPVLCEVVYRWFTPPAPARVLDPFAGGSARGIVAAVMGLPYVGIELRREQVQANKAQWRRLRRKLPPGVGKSPPKWIVGDARDVRALVQGRFDLVFTCPPY